MLELGDPDAPYGLRGVGEPPTISSTPAIVSALRAATGAALTRVPVRPDDMVGPEMPAAPAELTAHFTIEGPDEARAAVLEAVRPSGLARDGGPSELMLPARATRSSARSATRWRPRWVRARTGWTSGSRRPRSRARRRGR